MHTVGRGRSCNRQGGHIALTLKRERGIDANAVLHRLNVRKSLQERRVFVDDWAGKGVIGRELDKAIADCNLQPGTTLRSRLYVVADLCGAAHTAATTEDYLIPSSVLNATVSGLVSRSVLNSETIGPRDFHGCLYYREFEAQDLSRVFVDHVFAMMEDATQDPESGVASRQDLLSLRMISENFIRETMDRFQVLTENYVKPGIGEATRVLLRRTPHLLLLRNREDPEVRHLCLLADEKNVPVAVHEDLPYKAVALIRNLRL